jgi:hypothetical protein
MFKTEKELILKLQQMWFQLYRRIVKNDSSGFEHVFVGEEKDGKVSAVNRAVRRTAGRVPFIEPLEGRQGGRPAATAPPSPSRHADRCCRCTCRLQVTGCHNWIQLYLEEQKGTMDYLGFIKPRVKVEGEGRRTALPSAR